jgi:hypothetical protein
MISPAPKQSWKNFLPLSDRDLFSFRRDWQIVRFDLGLDGLPYVVFQDNSYSWEYYENFDMHGVAHFGNYENAVLLQNTIGM